MRRFEGLPLEDAARGLLDAKVDFLTRQRQALEAARADTCHMFRGRGAPATPQNRLPT
jgi:hypothetical protein